MINILCRAVETAIKRPLTMSLLPKGKFRHSVQFREITPFMENLAANDLAMFKDRATFSINNENEDERSVVIPLSRAIELDGKTIQALRLKGVFPDSDNGVVKPYLSGRGFVDKRLEPTGGSRIRGRKKLPAEYSANGTMSLERVTTEVLTALKLGPALTDPILGFGSFEGLTFNGQPVGFAVYGLEKKTDERLGQEIATYSWRGDRTLRRNLAGPVEHAGRLLRTMHEMMIFHRSPHTQNFRVLTENGARRSRILDLDATLSLAGIPASSHAAFLFIDLSKTLEGFYNWIELNNRCGRAAVTRFSFIPLLPHFLWGYFKGDLSLPFVQGFSEYYDGSFNFDDSERLTSTFGLPYLVFDQPAEKDFVLTRPRVDLENSPEDIEIDLKDYAGNGIFGQFYEAIESVARSL